MRADIDAGHHPYRLTMVGLRMEGDPIGGDYLSDFWLVAPSPDAEPVGGFVTSASYAPKLGGTNVALARLPVELAVPGGPRCTCACRPVTRRAGASPAVVSAFPIE